MTTNAAPRASLYCRISVSDEASTSLDRQEEDLRALAAQHGATVVAVHADDGISGAKADRPGLLAWLADAQEGRADLLLVWDFTRLSREGLRAAARVVDVLEASGARLLSKRDALDSAQQAFRLVAAVLSETARAERESIRARVTSTVRHLPTVGRFPGGVVPYGYTTAPHPSGAGRILVPEPAEAEIVREVAARILSGSTVYAECQRLNRAGVKPRRAREWGAASLRWMLTGDAVLGRVRVGGSGRRGDKDHRTGALLLGDDGLPAVVWEPLLDVETVERLRAILAPRRSQERRRRAARTASGLLRCWACGTTLVVKSTRDRKGCEVASYVCPTRGRGRLCDSPVSVKCADAEDALTGEFLAQFGALDQMERVETVRTVAGLAEVEEALRLAGQEITQPGADVAAIAARIADLSARRDLLAAQPSGTEVRWRRTGATVLEAWTAADVAGRRAMLAAVLPGGVEVRPSRGGAFDPARLVAEWRLPDAEEGGDRYPAGFSPFPVIDADVEGFEIDALDAEDFAAVDA